MAGICLYLELPPYLKDWAVHTYGGEEPVTFPRGSIERLTLEMFLAKPPTGAAPEMGSPDKLAVVIPEFRVKRPETHHYLPHHARELLLGFIRQRFDLDMWQALKGFVMGGRSSEQLIYAFLESRGIEETEANWCAVAKRYQRRRDNFLGLQRQKKRRNSDDKKRGM